MATSLFKKTSIFTTKRNRNQHNNRLRRRSKCSIRDVSVAVISSINKSICRIIKTFSAMSKNSSTRIKNSRRNGYHKLHEDKHMEKFLQPMSSWENKTIFVDLDETLVHSMCSPEPDKYDFKVQPTIQGEKVNFYVLKRPFVDELLDTLSQKYEIVVFTAGLEEYASEVIDKLDWKAVISQRLYRDDCKRVNGRYVKDLSEMGRDLKNVVIIDDNPDSFMYQKDNGITIKPFINDPEDEELWRLIDFFEEYENFDDMRDAIKHYLAQQEMNCIRYGS